MPREEKPLQGHTPIRRSFSWDFKSGKSPKSSKSRDRGLSESLRSVHNRCCVGQQGDISGPLDGQCQHPLVFGAVAGNPARGYLSPFGCKITDRLDVFIIDCKAAVSAEFADLSSVIGPSEFIPATPGSVRVAVSIVCHFPSLTLQVFRFRMLSSLLRLSVSWPHLRLSMPPDQPGHSA